MLHFNNDPEIVKLTKVISDQLDKMTGTDPISDGYGKAVDNLHKLMKLKTEILKTETELLLEERKLNLDETKIGVEKEKLNLDEDKLSFEKEKSASWRPSPDAVIGAAASILGIVAILHYEKVGVVTSKALGFIGKMK